jgi:hypothetical protein
MRKFFTLLLFISFATMEALGAPPTVPASNFIFSNTQGGQMSIRFTIGNGTNRIVVMKAGSEVTGLPVNGTQYNYNLAYSIGGNSFTGPGEYVVFRGSNNQFTVTNLQPGITYHISVFEYNGSGAAIEYLMIPLKGSETTSSAPTTQASGINFTNVTGNSLRINWNAGTGSNRLVVARKNAPVNATPVNLTDYSSNVEFGTGSVLNGDNYVLYENTGNNATITKLEPNTTYHFSIFEFNGANSPVYLVPGATASFKTAAGPTQAAANVSVSSREGDRLTFTASGGNGSRKLFILKKGSAVTGVPVNGAAYSPSTTFGLGEQLNAGEHVISNTTNQLTVTNLEPSTTYFIRVFDFDIDALGNTYYLTSASGSGSFMTATVPTQVTGINFINVNGSSMTVKYTGGNGSYRMLIMKEGSPVDAEPAELIRYNGSPSFGLGDELGTGNFVIQGGVNGTNINVLNLQPGKTYHVAMHEFQGNNYPVYARPAATASITIPNEPTSASSGFYKNSIEGNSFRANWINGDGAKRIVIARKGAPVTVVPVDNTTYTANPNFNQGTEISPGQFVVYDGSHTNVEIKNLEINSTYHIAVFEYNTSASGPDYLASNPLIGDATTLGAPTVQTTNLFATSIQQTSATINYSIGNGSSRIFVIRKGGPVDADPVDLEAYATSTFFGSGTQIGTGNFVVFKSSGTQNFNVINLQPNSVYHVAAYEYFGSSGMVFLRPGATSSFTTLPAAGDITPTLAATNPFVTEVEGNKFRLDWTNGNGANRLIVAKQGSATTSAPLNGNSYNANAAFTLGQEIGTGEYVVYNGGGNSITITNLLPSQVYHFTIYEYNGTGGTATYQTVGALALNASTLSAPVSGSSLPLATNTPTGLKIEWTPGSGSSRMVVVRETEAVTSVPADLSIYPANANFQSGSQIGLGEYVVYSGTSNSVVVTGLTANKTYHYTIFDYNGTTGPVYNIVNKVSGSALITSTLPVIWSYVTATPSEYDVTIKWGTLQEENTSHFIVERNEGNGYVEIANVQAAGNSTLPLHYSFDDAAVASENASYRIRQVDIDGKSSYSQVVHVRRNAARQLFSVFPNPATSQVTVKFDGNNSADLRIIDTKGTVLQRLKVSNNQTIDLGRLPAGVYHFVMSDGRSKRLVKL